MKTPIRIQPRDRRLSKNAPSVFDVEKAEILSLTQPAPSRRRSHHSSQLKRLNDVTSWLLVFVVLAAPIPMASNRPIFWMLSAVTVGILACLYFLLLGLSGSRLRHSPAENPVLATGVLLYFGFLVIQILPIGSYFGGFAFHFPNEEVLYSNTLSLTPGAGALALLRTITYGFFFFLMLQVCSNRARAHQIAWSLFFGVTAHAIWGLLLYLELIEKTFWGEKEYYIDVVTGTFINRNSFATFLAFGLVLGTSLLNRKKSNWSTNNRLGNLIQAESIKKYILYLLLFIIFATLLNTQSRMRIFAASIAVTFALCAEWMKRDKSDRQTFLLIIVGIIFAYACVTFFYGRGLVERLIFVERAGDIRSALYAQVIDMIQMRPFLGYGMNSFELTFPLFHKVPVSLDLVWDKAHSTYLTLWSEMGVVFGSLPLLLSGGFFVHQLKALRNSNRDYALSISALAVIIVAGIHSLVDFSLEIQANVFLFLAILALGLAKIQKPKSSPLQDEVE